MLVEPDRLTLINSGPPGDGKKIVAYIQHLGRGPSELEQVIVTHGHPDHTGSLKSLSRRTGVAIAAHLSDTRYRAKSGSRWLHYPGQPPVFD